MNQVIKLIIINPFLYLAIELLILNSIWGLEKVNEFSTIPTIAIVAIAILIPVLISGLVIALIRIKEEKEGKIKNIMEENTINFLWSAAYYLSGLWGGLLIGFTIAFI